ncbi:hypothetical protein SAMN06265360_10712 [Haloechinothrix alba]|uniref:Uncharacterized protein n=1 Tax=Haloechinothrix alba TaxID=664784 RepID=A0A238WNW8_9PSEU|nr:hypothetical protein [Haloechinothrix alba]SNR47954.1 hypothetical protein SAMN06265360_10712 [Haloechinothrix alba]
MTAEADARDQHHTVITRGTEHHVLYELDAGKIVTACRIEVSPDHTAEPVDRCPLCDHAADGLDAWRQAVLSALQRSSPDLLREVVRDGSRSLVSAQEVMRSRFGPLLRLYL